MNNTTEKKKLSTLSIIMVVVFGIMFLFSLTATLVLAKSNPSMAMTFACAFCFLPAIGFYLAFSLRESFEPKQRIIAMIASGVAFIVFDIIYIIVLNALKGSLTDGISVGSVSPVVTYILSAITGQVAFVFAFLKLCRSKKKWLDILCVPVSVIMPILAVALAIVVIIVVGVFIIVTLLKWFVRLRNATDYPTPNWTNQTFTVNDGGLSYTLKYYGRDFANNADEFVDEYNNRWLTQDQGRTFFRK